MKTQVTATLHWQDTNGDCMVKVNGNSVYMYLNTTVKLEQGQSIDGTLYTDTTFERFAPSEDFLIGLVDSEDYIEHQEKQSLYTRNEV